MSECSLLEAAIAQGVVNMSSTMGPTYLGILASACVYGVTCLQAFHYYRSEKAKSDHAGLKALVAFLTLLSTVQEVFVAIHGYHYLVLLVANPCELLGRLVWYYPAEMIITGILEFTVESFLVYRVYKLSHNIHITTICAILILAGSVLTISMIGSTISGTGTESFLNHTAIPSRLMSAKEDMITALLNERPLGMVNTGVAAFGEACTTASMWYYLRRNRTGFRRSDSLVTSLIQLTVSTGALTVLISLGEFLAWLTSNRQVGVFFFTFMIGKVYVNALITTLNMRGVVGGSSCETSTQGVNSIHLSRIHHFRSGKTTSNPNIEVAVDNVVEFGHPGKEVKTVVLQEGHTADSSLSSIGPEFRNDGKV